MAIGNPVSLGAHGDSSNADTVALILAAAVSAGDTIIAVASRHFYEVGTTFADSKSNTWHGDFDLAHTNGRDGIAVASCVVGTALAIGDTITVTFAGGPFAFERLVTAFVVSGLAVSPSLDQVVGQPHFGGSNANADSGATSATTQASEIAIGIAVADDTNTATPGAGYTEISDSLQGVLSIQAAYKQLSATGTQQYTATLSGATDWCAAVLTYKADTSSSVSKSASDSAAETEASAIAATVAATEAGALTDAGTTGVPKNVTDSVAVADSSSLVQNQALQPPSALGSNVILDTGNTVTLSPSGALIVGDFLIVIVWWRAYAVGVVVTDSQGNTYQADQEIDGTGFSGCGVFSSKITHPLSTSDVITATYPAGPFFGARGIGAVKATGLAPSGWLDQHVASDNIIQDGNQSTNPRSGNTAALAQADELIIGVANWVSTSAAAPGAGYTELLDFDSGGNGGAEVAYKIVAATAAQGYTATLPGADTWTAITATYKAKDPTVPAAVDQAAVSDTAAPAPALSRTEAAAMSESAAAGVVQAVTASDSVASTNVSQVDSQTTAPEVTVSEAAQVVATPQLAGNDPVTLGEQAQVSSTASVQQVGATDQATEADSSQIDRQVSVAGADQITEAEQATPAVTLDVVDQGVVNETSQVISATLLTGTDQTTVGEQAVVGQVIPATTAEQAAMAEQAQIDVAAAPDTPIHITLRLADADITVYDIGDEAFIDVMFTDADTGQTIVPDDVAAIALRPDWSTVALVPFARAGGYRVPCLLDVGGGWRVKVSCGAPGPSVEQVLLFAR